MPPLIKSRQIAYKWEVAKMECKEIRYPDFVDKKNIEVKNYGYDEKFRFLLKVPFNKTGENYLNVIMKNPSYASEQQCDRTMLKVCHAAYTAKYDGVFIMNLFPYRSKEAHGVFSNFYLSDKELYKTAMALNRQVIKEVCSNGEVVFAWGNNTIKKNKTFDAAYDEIASNITDIVKNCAKRVLPSFLNKNGKHPIHGLRWWHTILNDVRNDYEKEHMSTRNKHPVLHRNIFGLSAEICNSNQKDFEIYCYKRNKICIPDCTDCKYFRPVGMDMEIDCEWEDFDGNYSLDERIVQNYEKHLEYNRVQNIKSILKKIK